MCRISSKKENFIRVQNRSIQRELICLKLWPDARSPSSGDKRGKNSMLLKSPSKKNLGSRLSKSHQSGNYRSSVGGKISTFDRSSYTPVVDNKPLLEEREMELEEEPNTTNTSSTQLSGSLTQKSKNRLDHMQSQIHTFGSRLDAMEKSSARIENLLINLDQKMSMGHMSSPTMTQSHQSHQSSASQIRSKFNKPMTSSPLILSNHQQQQPLKTMTTKNSSINSVTTSTSKPNMISLPDSSTSLCTENISNRNSQTDHIIQISKMADQNVKSMETSSSLFSMPTGTHSASSSNTQNFKKPISRRRSSEDISNMPPSQDLQSSFTDPMQRRGRGSIHRSGSYTLANTLDNSLANLREDDQDIDGQETYETSDGKKEQ